MSGAFLSSSWHLVAHRRPRLQPHAEVTRHRARGQAHYTIRNAASGRVYQVPPATYQFLGLLDGTCTVEAAWTATVDRLDEDAPTQDEVIALLSQLHDADLLQSDAVPDRLEATERRRKHRRQTLRQHIGNPMSLRLPLWDPDRFLCRTLPWVRPLTGWFGAVLWLVVVVPALVLAGVHWTELTDGATDRILSAENVLLIALVYPVVKALHELGHAYASRAGGGPVHEVGVMMLVFYPVPYVDASASSAFRSRWRRVGVGAAGMMVETFVAALALYVWLAVEPGPVRATAFAVMVVGGVSTVLFNGNPLLRYDGYFILSDLLGIPNLASRASRLWAWVVQRHAFGLRTPPPPAAPGERAWLLPYAPAALVARISVSVSIALLIATKFFVLGILIAGWTLASTLLLPLVRMAHHVVAGPGLARNRRRAVLVTIGAAASLAVLLALVPAPLHTMADGVVWLPDDSQVRAGGEGFMQRLAVAPGTRVHPGDVLAELRDPEVEAAAAAARARVAGLEAKLGGEEFADRVQANLTRRALVTERSTLARLQQRAAALLVRSAAEGTFTVPKLADLPGRYLKRGELFGYVLPDASSLVRVVVPQDDVDLVRGRLRGVSVLGAADLGHPVAAHIVREVPGASDELPSRAFATEGGGERATDPRDQNRPRTLSRTFQFDLRLDQVMPAAGSHVWARFDHGPEPLALQAWRRLRQLLLTQFNA